MEEKSDGAGIAIRAKGREGDGTMKRQSWVKSGQVLESGSTVIMGNKRSVCNGETIH